MRRRRKHAQEHSIALCVRVGEAGVVEMGDRGWVERVGRGSWES